jgi:hypothetical protein
MANLQEECHVEYVSGTLERYVITTTLTAATIPTELPHRFIFVYKIVDRADPKRDALARVARISDLTTLPLGRNAGLDSSTGEYLSTTSTLTYPTLDEAIAAKKAVTDRCNSLITEWINFSTNFNAPSPNPANIMLPSPDPSQKQQLISAYKAAKENRYALGLARQAAAQALVQAESAFTGAQAAVNDFTAFVQTANQVVTEAQNSLAFLRAVDAAGTTFLIAAGCAPADAQSTFQNALNQATNQQALLAGYTADHSTFAAALQSYLAGTLQPQLIAAQAALAAAQANDITAAQQYASAQQTEQAALGAVLAICPDFQASAICLIPG